MPKISIITTSYKHQDFIKETIESVLSQTFEDWELLIWDDSPDILTRNIIEKYVEKYPSKIKAWHHSENKWIIDNMNFLLENISPNSEYITFLEWDDIFIKDNLEEKILYLSKNKDINFIYNWYSEINSKWIILNNNIKQKIIKNISINNIIETWENFIKSFWCITFRSKIFNKFYPLSSPNWEKMFWLLDFFTYMKILPNIKIWHIEKPLLLYRYHDNNFSAYKDKNKLFKENISIYKYLLNQYKLEPKITKIIKYRINYIKSISNIYNNNKKESFKYLIKTFKYSLNLNLFNRVKIIVRIIIPKIINNYIIKFNERK